MSFTAGISPADFWGMTPWQCFTLIKERNERALENHNRQTWLMWHGAVLQRIEKIPPLDKFIAGKKPMRGINENAIINHLKAYQRKRGDK